MQNSIAKVYDDILANSNHTSLFRFGMVSISQSFAAHVVTPFIARVWARKTYWGSYHKHCEASLGRHAPFPSMETNFRLFEEMSPISGYLPSNAQ